MFVYSSVLTGYFNQIGILKAFEDQTGSASLFVIVLLFKLLCVTYWTTSNFDSLADFGLSVIKSKAQRAVIFNVFSCHWDFSVARKQFEALQWEYSSLSVYVKVVYMLYDRGKTRKTKSTKLSTLLPIKSEELRTLELWKEQQLS